MTRRLLTILPLLALVALFSCNRKQNPSYGDDFTRGYYPLLIGHYVLYDVDSTIWNGSNGTIDTSHCQMRYSVTDTFRDNQARLSYRIEVLMRRNDTSQFAASDVFYATPTTAGLEVFQNNLRFIKMIYPVTAGATWNGNSLIATADQDLSYFADWTYTYGTPNQPYDNGRLNFDNAVSVLEDDETTNDPNTMPTAYASRTFSKEVYAFGVGLIYREFTHWVYDYNPGASVNAREGRSVVMRAIEHN